MDEPFSALDPVNVQLLKEAFLAMRDRGKTLIFSTHQMEQVEELCESITIIDAGRVVEAGSVRDVKRRMGRRVVRLAIEGTDGVGADGSEWIEQLQGVRITRRGEDYLEMHVADGTDPEAILRAAIGRGDRVTRFEIADPSLEEIFIERVGHRATEEEHLGESRRSAETKGGAA
jgi:ABC-2 type transport system ATP-binding protein